MNNWDLVSEYFSEHGDKHVTVHSDGKGYLVSESTETTETFRCFISLQDAENYAEDVIFHWDNFTKGVGE